MTANLIDFYVTANIYNGRHQSWICDIIEMRSIEKVSAYTSIIPTYKSNINLHLKVYLNTLSCIDKMRQALRFKILGKKENFIYLATHFTLPTLSRLSIILRITTIERNSPKKQRTTFGYTQKAIIVSRRLGRLIKHYLASSHDLRGCAGLFQSESD